MANGINLTEEGLARALAPFLKDGIVVLFLRLHGGVAEDCPPAHGRGSAFVPLEERRLEDRAASRCGALLELTGDGIFTQDGLITVNHMPGEPGREQKLPVFLAGVDEAD